MSEPWDGSGGLTRNAVSTSQRLNARMRSTTSLADEPRQTNAVALRDTTLMALTREGIANVNLFHPFIASRLFLNLARDVSCRWVDFIVRVKSQGGRLAEKEENK